MKKLNDHLIVLQIQPRDIGPGSKSRVSHSRKWGISRCYSTMTVPGML